MRELLEYAGGMRNGHDLKFWLPEVHRCRC